MMHWKNIIRFWILQPFYNHNSVHTYQDALRYVKIITSTKDMYALEYQCVFEFLLRFQRKVRFCYYNQGVHGSNTWSPTKKPWSFNSFKVFLLYNFCLLSPFCRMTFSELTSKIVEWDSKNKKRMAPCLPYRPPLAGARPSLIKKYGPTFTRTPSSQDARRPILYLLL